MSNQIRRVVRRPDQDHRVTPCELGCGRDCKIEVVDGVPVNFQKCLDIGIAVAAVEGQYCPRKQAHPSTPTELAPTPRRPTSFAACVPPVCEEGERPATNNARPSFWCLCFTECAKSGVCPRGRRPRGQGRGEGGLRALGCASRKRCGRRGQHCCRWCSRQK